MRYNLAYYHSLPGAGQGAAGHCSLPVGSYGGFKISRARNVPTLPPLPSQRTMAGGNVKAFTQAPIYLRGRNLAVGT